MNYNAKHIIIPYDRYKKLLKKCEDTKPNLPEKPELSTSTLNAVHVLSPGDGISQAQQTAGETLLQLLPPYKDINPRDIVLYTQTNSPPPAEFRKIVALLAESDIPLSLIANRSLRELLLTIRHLETDSDSEEEQEKEHQPQQQHHHQQKVGEDLKIPTLQSKQKLVKTAIKKESSPPHQAKTKARLKWVSL